MNSQPKLPRISIIIPTLNSANVLPYCLKSIRHQTYPQKLIEIIIIDGGSRDQTLIIAKKYKVKIFQNPLKTAESGKAIGVKKATGKYLALIDADNILPIKNWFQKMIQPLETNQEIVGTEPWSYTYRHNGGFIERYSALTGVNDPYCLITNHYDRKNLLRSNWNGLHIPVIDHPSYQSFQLTKSNRLPTIGANGTIFRKSFFTAFSQKYLFDVDIISNYLLSEPSLTFAKVKVSIVHTYCESSIYKFYKKQLRRVKDLYTFRQLRSADRQQNNLFDQIKFSFYVISILPMLLDTLFGLIKKPDPAWLFHPLACLITLYCYSLVTFQNSLGYHRPLDRQTWSQ